ncbi:MAG: RNA polymerase sigma-70 factor [Chitinophagaceae bacterium]|jgi:RNA polymerase sigma-70 factor (ECF subfamily)|nr:RNA polymerase sigma-70 factor [Chitinophagaceae bacterium]
MEVFYLQSLQVFEAFFQTHHARMCYHAKLTVEDASVAEDIAQDAFMNLWEIRDRFPNEATAKAWLYKAIRHKALNHIRHEKVKVRKGPDLVTPESDGQNYLNDIVKSEVVGHIHQIIETLPDGCKRIFKLSYFEGLKNHEIASQLNLSVNTVKTHKARALQLLRLKINPELLGLFLLYCRVKSSMFN